MLPETTVEESGERSKHVIYSLWPLKVMTHYFARGSHSFTFVSRDPEIKYRAFLIMAEHLDKCPDNLPATTKFKI
jgi:hypothetical protein